MRWKEAVLQADFGVYGVVEPLALDRWTGSYGSTGSSRTTAIGVRHDIEGTVVEVNTYSTASRIPPDHRLRLRIGRLLRGIVESGSEPVALPVRLEIDIVPFVRDVALDGVDTEFSCVRVDGMEAWAGETVLGDGTTVEIVAGQAVPGLALGTLLERDLIELAA